MIEHAIIIAFATLFLHACTWEGMIFGFIPAITWNWAEWIKKPLYDCPICMSFWWGGMILLLLGNSFSIEFFITLLAAGGINVLLVSIISTMDNE